MLKLHFVFCVFVFCFVLVCWFVCFSLCLFLFIVCLFLLIPDNEIPVFSVASITNINQNTDSGKTYATVTWTVPTATDNSGNAPTVTASHTPGQFNIGTYTVVYTAKDAADNTATLSFTITITGSVLYTSL